MLNYGYGILANQIRTDAVAVGLDPTIGVMHRGSRNPIPLVYDLMEPLRPLVDRAILEFAQSHKFAPGDFTIGKWGGCRLNPELARAITGVIPDEFDEADLVEEFVRRIAPVR
jgi:CRISPR-associated endonuclease Cas1